VTLSANLCRAACRETPRAAASWFQDRPCSRAVHGAVEACLVGLDGVGGDCDRLQITEILDLGGFGVERVGELVKPLGRLLDLLVTVPTVITSSQESSKLRA
jgi:hypothetical protein